MKTFLGMKTANKPEFRYLAWEIAYLGWCAGCYESLESTDKHMKLYYAVRAIECLKKIREMDNETYNQLRADYRSTLIEMISTIKNH